MTASRGPENGLAEEKRTSWRSFKALDLLFFRDA
jgi:hypothetical protein